MLPNPPEAAVRQPGAVEAERKQVTALFCDLTGFTALAEKLDPEDTRQIVGEVFACAAGIVARYEGRIEKFVGDAVMALFGLPAAHEDDPVRALRAALELHAAVADASAGVQARSGVAIALHSGVNTGIVVTGELQFGQGTAGPLGDTINLAARLMAAAPSGEIWVGPETRRLADAAFEFDDLGLQPFKGKAAPVAVARLRGPRSRSDAPARSFRGAFVGRQAELGALLGAAEKMRDGQAQVIGVRGDAGTGKTRLFAEFRARAGADLQWLEGRAYPYAQNIPYAPVIDLLGRSWAIDETDRPVQVRRKIETALAEALPPGNDALPLLLHLFHLPQDAGVVVEREAFPDRLLRALRDLLSSLARRGPVVACLQDLHWVDPSTDALLRALVDSPVPGVLLMVNFRPAYAPPSAMPLIDLAELSTRQTRDLLASLLQGDPPDALARFIAERSDGNPFYVEEVVNALVETQALVRGDAGWQLARPLAEAGIPPTVRGVIAARIDRLDDVRRRVLRHAAVVGREFLYAVVAQVCDDVDAVAPSLADLTAVDLIRKRRDEPDLEYLFKHALTQDVAYEGLLKAERQVLHARTARVIEAVLAERLQEYVETLAYHYLRGGVKDRAVHYLIEAGRKCVERYALTEAANHFREAYALLSADETLPARGLAFTRLLNAWSHVYYYEGAIGAWRELLERHLAEAEACGDDRSRTMYLGWVGNVRAFHGDFIGSIDILDRAVDVGRTAGAREALAYVTAWRAFTLLELGRLQEAIDCAQALDQTEAERSVSPFPFVKAQGGLSMALTSTGDARRACEIDEELVRFGQASGNRRAESMGRFVLTLHWSLLLDFERADAQAQAGAAAAKDPLFVAMNHVMRAIALLGRMRTESTLQVAKEWMPYLERHQNRWFSLMMNAAQSSAMMAAGDLSAGLRKSNLNVDEAITMGAVSTRSLVETLLALTWVSVARRDVQPPLRALLANPWFTFTQAPLAARRAMRLIAQLRSKYEAEGRWGTMNLIELADARLRAHRGDVGGARDCLARIEGRRREAGLDDRPAGLQALAEEIERRAARH